MIRLPERMVFSWESNQSIYELIDKVFPHLDGHVNDATYMEGRALVTPINDDADMLNEKIINMFPGKDIILYSYDFVEDDTHNFVPA